MSVSLESLVAQEEPVPQVEIEESLVPQEAPVVVEEAAIEEPPAPIVEEAPAPPAVEEVTAPAPKRRGMPKKDPTVKTAPQKRSR